MPPYPECDKAHVGTAVIIRRLSDDLRTWNWLMIHRIGEHGKDRWSVPGGWMDENEYPEVAAFREVKEEVGTDLVLTTPKFLGFTNDVVDPSIGHLHHSLTLWYSCVCLRGEPVNMEPEKVDIVEWKNPKDMDPDTFFGPLMRFWNELNGKDT